MSDKKTSKVSSYICPDSAAKWYMPVSHVISFFHVQAVNEVETVGPQPPLVSEEGDEAVRSGDGKCIHRTGTRISLTCRLVLKVHHKLFKF